jgi:two-component system sensor histidine kinase PilS (NtrC family)
MAEQLHVFQSHASSNTSYAYAGMLGISFFTIAYLSYVLAKRTEQSDMLATQQQQTILNLEELNQYIIQHLQSGIVISNSEQQIKMCNEATLNICKSNEDASQLHHLLQLSPRLAESFQIWLDDKNQNFAIIRLPNQSEIHVRFSLVKTRLETFHMIILEDIALYNQRLQQSKLASLGCLTASIAHEIRNPLSSISYSNQLLLDSNNLSTEDLELIEISTINIERINNIISDILQISKDSNISPTKVNLLQFCEQLRIEYLKTQNSIQIEIINNKKTLYFAPFDKNQLRQVMVNLIDNAVLHCKKNHITAKITMTLDIDEHSGLCAINIKDNGPGIKANQQNKLFEPFFTTEKAGTGLGLYISKELCTLNQAHLSYVDTPNVTGATFNIRFSHPNRDILVKINDVDNNYD